MTTVAVLIPYFQKKPGILRRALNSVFAQQIPPGVSIDIILVDDGSPHPARSEISGLNISSPFSFKLIEQSNGGVACARNTGLQNLPVGIQYIAFLDSDDIWDPDHLQHAISYLDKGFDYYFCNNRKRDHHDSYFVQANFDGFLAKYGKQLNTDEFYEIDNKAKAIKILRVRYRREAYR